MLSWFLISDWILWSRVTSWYILVMSSALRFFLQMKLCFTVFLFDLYVQLHLLILWVFLLVSYLFYLVACEFSWGFFPRERVLLVAIDKVFGSKCCGAITSILPLDLGQNSASFWIRWVRQHQVPITIFCQLCYNFLSLLRPVSIGLWVLENLHGLIHETMGVKLLVSALF